MKLPMAPTEALNLILSDCRPHPMDVPTLTCSTGSSHFAISCGIGFDAGVCASASDDEDKDKKAHSSENTRSN